MQIAAILGFKAHHTFLFCEQARLVDFRPSQFPQLDERGRVEAFSAPFKISMGDAVFEDVYVKDAFGGLSTYADTTAKELSDSGHEIEPEDVKAAVRIGFEQERARIQRLADDIALQHNMESIARIRIAKIYPNNLEEVIRVGSKQTLAAMHFVMSTSPQKKDDQIRCLDAALEKFEWNGSREATIYGPASRFFFGHEIRATPAAADTSD